jgi:hypothetical protein
MRRETHHFARNRAAHSRSRLDLVPPRTRRPDTETSTPVEIEAQTRYLDFDGDGLLDAIEVTERIMSVDPNSGERRTLQTIRTLAAGIEEDGAPRLVTRSSMP